MRKVSVLLALLLLVPAAAQAKSLEELLVEKGVITKAEARGSMQDGGAKVYWNKGTRLDFPDSGFTANITTQIQTRYTYTDGDDNLGDSNSSSFEVKRARLKIAGSALHKEFDYVFQVDMVGADGADGEGSVANVQDMYLKWNACDWASVQAGQFKTYISRQFMTSSTSLQFVNRSVASEYYDLGRQNGASVNFMDLADGMVELHGGIWNGESTGEGQNLAGVDTSHTGGLMLRVNPVGEMNPYEEGDIDMTEDTAVSLGVAYLYSSGTTETEDFNDDFDAGSLSIDANVKVQGFSLHGEFFYRDFEYDDANDSAEPVGFYIQTGYFVDPKIELGARYSLVDCDSGKAPGSCAGVDELQEASATINYYWWKHHLKAQVGYEHINEDPEGGGTSEDTNRWMLQLSSWF